MQVEMFTCRYLYVCVCACRPVLCNTCREYGVPNAQYDIAINSYRHEARCFAFACRSQDTGVILGLHVTQSQAKNDWFKLLNSMNSSL